MATAVQIELKVDEQGAVQGIRSFDTAVKGTTGSVKQLGNEMRIVGGTAAKAGVQARSAVQGVGVESLNTLERTRLVTEEFGVRLPRAMIRLAAQSKVTQAAISAVGSGIIALGAIQVGAMIFEQMYTGAKKLWDNYLSLNKAAEDYAKQVAKTRDEDFGNTRSIEDTRMRIDAATRAAKEYRAAAEQAHGSALSSFAGAGPQGFLGRGIMKGDMDGATFQGGPQSGIMGFVHAHKLAGSAVHSQEQKDKLDPKMVEQQHEINVQQIEYNHALDGTLRGVKKINAEKEKERQLNAETRTYNNQLDRAHGNPVAANSGAAEESLKNGMAERQADVELFNERRAQGEELRHLRESALEASLTGVALYRAREAAAIEDLKDKDIDSVAARKAVHDRFHSEELSRLDAERQETEKIQMQGALAGFTGLQKIRGQSDIEIGGVRGDKNLPDEMKDQRVAAIKQKTLAEELQAEQEFHQRVNEMSETSAERQISGFERIRAQAQAKVNALQKDYEKLYGADRNSPDYQAHVGDLNQGKAAIGASAGQEAAELARRNADETSQIEMEARARSLSAEKQQTLAIQTEYQQRVTKYQQELRDKQISDDDYNRRVLAAGELRDGQMVEASKQAREKMAGQFSHFFENPLSGVKEFGDKAAGEAAAAMMQRVQGRMGMPGGATASTRGGMFGGIFNKIAGTRNAPMLEADHHAETRGEAAHGTIMLSSAVIHIGAAQVSYGGGFGGGSRMMNAGFGGFGGGSSGGFGGGYGPVLSSTPGGTYTGGGFSSGGFSGGAGDGGYSGSSGGFSGGAPPAASDKVGGMLGNAQQAFSLGKAGAGLFHHASFGGGDGGTAETQSDTLTGTLNQDGTFTSKSNGGGMLSGGGIGANAMGAAGGAAGLFSAYKGNGGASGALGGAMSGMQLGMALGGPMGAAVGAAAGAIVGAIGFGGREKARVYDLKTVRPRIKNDFDSFQQGSMDYMSAYSDLQGLYRDANMTTNAMGPGAKGYYQDTMKPEILASMAKLTGEQRGGRSLYSAQTAQFASGTDFVARSGLAVIHHGERIVGSDQNERITRSIESGMSPRGVAGGYRDTMVGSGRGSGSTSHSSTFNVNLHAIDAKSGAQWLMQNKHIVRKALNSSYAENSGGADA